jgi:hypothetical protein
VPLQETVPDLGVMITTWILLRRIGSTVELRKRFSRFTPTDALSEQTIKLLIVP